jgi:hypothetical protein
MATNLASYGLIDGIINHKIFEGRRGQTPCGRGGKASKNGIGIVDCQNNIARIFAAARMQLWAREFVSGARTIGPSELGQK